MKRRAAILGLWLAAGIARGAEPAEPEHDQLFRIRFLPFGSTSAATETFTLGELNAALLQETNRVRVAHGRRPLRPLAALAAAADDQSTYMALTFRVEHTSPFRGQHDAVERTQNHGLGTVSLLAENVLSTGIAPPCDPPLSCASVAAKLVEQWMNSPGHRANLLNRDFTDLGCAARRVTLLGGTEEFFATQVFAAR